MMDSVCLHCGEPIPANHVAMSYVKQLDDGRLDVGSVHMGCKLEVQETYEPINVDDIPIPYPVD